jgi:hypothetical protein
MVAPRVSNAGQIHLYLCVVTMCNMHSSYCSDAGKTYSFTFGYSVLYVQFSLRKEYFLRVFSVYTFCGTCLVSKNDTYSMAPGMFLLTYPLQYQASTAIGFGRC